MEWLVENAEPNTNRSRLLSPDHPKYQKAIDWFQKSYFLPPGVESTIYTVNRTLVTVHATYLLPSAAAAAAAAGGGAAAAAPAAAAAAGGGGGPGNAGDAVHAKLMADSTQLG